MKHQKVQLLHLQASGQPRPLVTANVDKMARSIKELGLIQPIVVKPHAVSIGGLTEQGFQIVSGHHRVAAARSLGWTEIDAIVIEGAGHLDAELIEIDENLCRSELTASQRTQYTARRKQIWEVLHPEEEVQPAESSPAPDAGNSEVAPVEPPQFSGQLGGARPQSQGFAAETAAVTGESKSKINKRLAVADAIGDTDLSRIEGTSLDTVVELAALAKLGTEERAALIDRAQAGETVTARAPIAALVASEKPPGHSEKGFFVPKKDDADRAVAALRGGASALRSAAKKLEFSRSMKGREVAALKKKLTLVLEALDKLGGADHE
jgi:hypothetical protein